MINKVIKLKLQCYYKTSNIQICSELDLARTETRGQGHSDLETVGDSPGPKMYLHTKYGMLQ